MHHILYLSSAVISFTTDNILDILLKSRKFNSVNNITGCLFFNDENFLQIIEGEKSRIEYLMEKICKDSRHTGIIILFNEEITEREFPDWKMAFHDLSNKPKEIKEEFSDIIIQNKKEINLDQFSKKVKTFIKMYI